MANVSKAINDAKAQMRAEANKKRIYEHEIADHLPDVKGIMEAGERVQNQLFESKGGTD